MILYLWCHPVWCAREGLSPHLVCLSQSSSNAKVSYECVCVCVCVCACVCVCGCVGVHICADFVHLHFCVIENLCNEINVVVCN